MKKSEVVRVKPAPLSLFALILALFSFSVTTQANGSAPKLPIIQNVGVIPVQWEGSNQDLYGLEKSKQVVGEVFSKVVRNSHRFRVLNDDLVSGLWKDSAGRDELKNQFELHSFASLTAASRGDSINLVSRFMSPDLESYISESEVVSKTWLSGATRNNIYDRLETLVFRLINRIPVDVSVTSVQGTYITLSGGLDQGVHKDDIVRLVRTRIATLHPANGTWLSFQKDALGTAQVIEPKQHTSVAKLIALTRENAVEVGDGARIDAISGRVKFARTAEKKKFKDASSTGTIIVPPLFPSSGNDQIANQLPKQADGSTVKVDPAKNEKTVTAPEDGSDEGNFFDMPDMDMNLGGIAKKIVDDYTISGGLHTWDVTGPAPASGKIPLWLFNKFGIYVTKTLFYKIHVGYGGGIAFGSTANGDYFEYHSIARLYWEERLVLLNGIVKKWYAGGQAHFNGLKVNDETFGGGDWILGGAFGGLKGSVRIPDLPERIDWFSELALLPLNIGRFGYAGSRRSIDSASGWALKAGGFLQSSPNEIEWGSMIEYSKQNLTLSNGRRPSHGTFDLQLLAKFKM